TLAAARRMMVVINASMRIVEVFMPSASCPRGPACRSAEFLGGSLTRMAEGPIAPRRPPRKAGPLRGFGPRAPSGLSQFVDAATFGTRRVDHPRAVPATTSDTEHATCQTSGKLRH